ncbi:transposase [Acidihalobacter yilgarnensis]|uniref:Transposase n=1 Tax=Acidihalobacter yilgarnensis TaxID=2819280 RepID=A0A1D8IQ96_9GAMM|nr:RNA-guided endonuclease TnpB family protein [Acidihalobacter yilgarnensis]AOU98678.1 transposase [Acidihalobacter yilgarnensis]
MQIGNRFRCYPTPVQKRTLLRWIGCQRHIYNSKVREDQYFRCFARKSLQHTGQPIPIDQRYSQFKTELTPYLSEVPSVLLRNGAVLCKQAYGRYFSKLGGRPTLHKKHGKQAAWLTSEVFKFIPVMDADTGEVTGHQLHMGTQKFPVGILAFKAHKEFKLPASLHISIHAGRWHVSFNYDDGLPEPTDKDTTDWLIRFDEPELRKMTVGLDRGVKLPLAGSDSQEFDFSKVQKKRLLAQERHKKRWQRRQARRVKGSAGWVKAKRKVARYQRYGADVRRDVAHKTSHTLATDPRYKLFVFEALKVKNMTAKAKPKQDAQGRWIKNGAAAKSGLNKSILASTWGQTKTYLQYKARRQGKLVIEVPPFYSSQECAACGHIHQDNRVSQSEFVCLSCGNTDHADHNAAKVIALRGVRQLLSGKCVRKDKKRCRITRNKVGAEGSRTDCEESQSTLGETVVSCGGGNTPALWSLTQEETPTTTRLRA